MVAAFDRLGRESEASFSPEGQKGDWACADCGTRWVTGAACLAKSPACPPACAVRRAPFAAQQRALQTAAIAGLARNFHAPYSDVAQRHRLSRPFTPAAGRAVLGRLGLALRRAGCTARSGPLHDELAGMDAALFEAAFVTCDAGQVQSPLHRGRRVLSRQDRGEFWRGGEGHEVLPPRQRSHAHVDSREPGGLSHAGLWRGADGRHVFAKKGEPGSEEAKFVHLWKREAGGWRLARVLSFDHRPSATKAP